MIKLNFKSVQVPIFGRFCALLYRTISLQNDVLPIVEVDDDVLPIVEVDDDPRELSGSVTGRDTHSVTPGKDPGAGSVTPEMDTGSNSVEFG